MTQSIGCIVTMYAISPKLTTVMLVIVPGIILTGTLIGSLLRRLSRNAQEQVAQATATADEALSNIRVVRSFAMEEQEARYETLQYYHILVLITCYALFLKSDWVVVLLFLLK